MSFCSWHRGGPKATNCFGLELKKNVICSSKIKRENHQKPAGSWREHERNQTGRIVQRKGKNFRQGWVLFKTQMNNTMLQSRISLSGVVEFL